MQKRADAGGKLPDGLKAGVEALSGIALDTVRVQRNSPNAAIRATPDREHRPHEAWHVVQQQQGRVRPARAVVADLTIADTPDLEQEADRLGAAVLRSTARRTD